MAAATTFTLAHSVTFILAALGLVTAPASIVEPVIALSIAVVAAPAPVAGRATPIARDRPRAGRHGHLGLDRAAWTRLAVVFCFGLVHGLGFASALGLDRAFSWSLLSSLVVFNLGIESVQLAIILAVFPVLALLRRRAPLRRALDDRGDRRGRLRNGPRLVRPACLNSASSQLSRP